MAASRYLRALGTTLAVIVAPQAGHAQTPSGLTQTAAIAAPADKSDYAGRWTCMSATTVEIAAVSFDTRGQANAWVRIYRDKGEIVAAERISSTDIEQIRRLPCGGPDSDLGGVALIG